MEKEKLSPAPEQEVPQEAAEELVEESLVLKLTRPYVFEGKTYEELDLSGLEDVTAGTLENVGRQVSKKNPGINPAVLEMSTPFCHMLAGRVAKLPLEFFLSMPVDQLNEYAETASDLAKAIKEAAARGKK